MCRLRNELIAVEVVIAARHAEDAKVVHGEEDGMGADEGDPEMQLAQHIVQHAASDLRIPVIDAAENNQQRRHAHHHM